MRVHYTFIVPLVIYAFQVAACQDPDQPRDPAITVGPATSGADPGTGGSPTTGAPTTSAADTSTTDASTTDASTTGTSAANTGSTGTSTGEALPDASSSTTSGDGTSSGGTTGGLSTSSTSSESTGDGGDDSSTGAPELPPCFPRQVPWAQPCQSDFKQAQVLANLSNTAYGIAVDETHVYFTDYNQPGAPKLHRVSKCGGTPEVVASAGSNPCRIVLDDNFVFITDLVDNSAIYRVSKLKGSVGVVASNVYGCPSIVSDGNSILYSGHQEPGIWRVPKFGGDPELAFDTGTKHPGWIASNGVHIYWNETWNGRVDRIPLQGGPSEFVSDALGHYPYEVSCDHLYSDSLAAPYSFSRVPVTGGPVEKAALQSAHRSVMGDTHVYFTAGGEIVEVPLAGGAPAIVAKIGAPGLVAVDATHVFWTDTKSAVIRVAPRPKI